MPRYIKLNLQNKFHLQSNTNYFSFLIAIIYLLFILLSNNGFINLITQNKYKTSFLKNNKLLFNFVSKIQFNQITFYNTIIYSNNQLLIRQIDNNTLQNYINDAKGSTLKLITPNAPLNNKKYSYDAYGLIINNNQSKDKNLIPNNFEYNSERFDNNTNLQYLRARFYNPENKRFITQDTYDLLNKFGYVNANPIMNSDPQGHDAFTNWMQNLWNSSPAGKIGVIGIATGAAICTVGLGAAGYFGIRAICKRYQAKKQNDNNTNELITKLKTVSSSVAAYISENNAPNADGKAKIYNSLSYIRQQLLKNYLLKVSNKQLNFILENTENFSFKELCGLLVIGKLWLVNKGYINRYCSVEWKNQRYNDSGSSKDYPKEFQIMLATTSILLNDKHKSHLKIINKIISRRFSKNRDHFTNIRANFGKECCHLC